MGLFSAFCYYGATGLLIPAGIMMLPHFHTLYKTGILIYVIACSMLAFVGLFDLFASLPSLCKPSHSDGNGYDEEQQAAHEPLLQPQQEQETTTLQPYGSTNNGHSPLVPPKVSAPTHNKSLLHSQEFINFLIAFFFCFGGLGFLGGAALYWPSLPKSAAPLGTKIFRTGSCFYLAGSFTTLYTVAKPKQVSHRKKLYCMLFQYIVGAFLFIAGGVEFSQGRQEKGGLLWLVGGALFFGGASIGLYVSL
eukprot:m.274029 g.274029  ORF g.274029 m.274029 type:complete len:249 (+) comp66937_c0_seq1:32-778(+)